MTSISRRDFLKLAALGLSGMALRPFARLMDLPEFPQAERLGRVLERAEIKTRPDLDSATVNVVYTDTVLPWLREVLGRNPKRNNQRWVETPQGYLWAPIVQPVRLFPQTPLNDLPETILGKGMWMEVSVPYVDMILDNPPARAPSLQDDKTPRLYYSQIMWIDGIKQDEIGQILYHVKEPYGSYGDMFWAPAEAFRPLSDADVAPIRPEVENKRVVIDVNLQTLSCFEGDTEVYFCRVSTGAKFNYLGEAVDKWATPVGWHPIWRKLVSVHMSGGTTGGGYDLPGIGWTTLFVGNGVAVHSTFWHNNYGVPMSHGCVNARPEDAQWVFRWTQPLVGLYPGDLTVQMPGGTMVIVVDSAT